MLTAPGPLSPLAALLFSSPLPALLVESLGEKRRQVWRMGAGFCSWVPSPGWVVWLPGGLGLHWVGAGTRPLLCHRGAIPLAPAPPVGTLLGSTGRRRPASVAAVSHGPVAAPGTG